MPASLESGTWSASTGALQPAGNGGWVGYWSPGIGDPSLVGWLTVVLPGRGLDLLPDHAREAVCS